MTGPRIGTSVAALAASALLVVGCGSKSTNSPSASGSGGQATPVQMQQDGIRFSGCMHSHGVPTFPGPSDPHAFKNALDPKSPGAQSPTFQSAYTACRHLLPNGGHAPPDVRSRAQIAAFLAFARCIRGHGFPSFPDPTNTGELNHQMVASAGINLHQPAVQQAGDACVSVSHGFITKTDVARFVAGN
jgi:hypothetical protein